MHGEKASGPRFYLPSLVLAVCIAAAVFAACGSGGENEGSAASVASNNGSQGTSGESGAEGAGGGEASSGSRGSSQNSAGAGGAGTSDEAADGGETFDDEGNATGEAGSSQGGGDLGAQKAKARTKTRSTRSNGGQGGSSGDGGTEGLIARADSVCRRWGKKIEADALKDYSGDLNGSKAEQREGIESLTESVEKYLLVDLEAERREVGDLTASSADEREAQTVAVASIGELIDVGKSDPEGLIVGTSQTKEAETKAKGYGFNACGNLTGRLIS